MGCGKSAALPPQPLPKDVYLCYFNLSLGAEHWFIKVICGKEENYYQMPGSDGQEGKTIYYGYYPLPYEIKQYM